VIPAGIPSLTNIPAIHIVPVVPTFAPNIAAIADGKGNAPDATSPITAVVVSDEDCQRNHETGRSRSYRSEHSYGSCFASLYPTHCKIYIKILIY